MHKKNSMKKTYLFLLTLVSSLIIFFIVFLQQEKPTNLIESEQTSTETESLLTEIETESSINTETSTETEIVVIPREPLSYLEQCELDYVEQPVTRTREEAILKIKELSRWFPALYQVYLNEAQYPDELLRSGAGNPEMTDFLYGYLTRDAAPSGGFTDKEQPEDYPLFLQWDIRWGYMPYGSANIGATGCGPTCLSMAVFYLTGNRECTPDVIAQYSLDHDYYVQNVGTAWALLTEYPKEHGLTSTQIRLSEANLKKQLDKGNILICSVRPGDFTSSGHFIVIYGYDENGFKINDPKCVYRSRQSWTYEQIQDDIKNTWSIGK